MAPKPDWTDDDRRRLEELWATGLSGEKIARQIGRTKNSVLGQAHRMRLPGRTPAVVRKTEPLDAEKTELARVMWHERKAMSIPDIARALGVTVDVLRGKAFRLNWPARGFAKSYRIAAAKTIVAAPVTPEAQPFIMAPPVSIVFKPRPPRACCWPMWGHNERPTHRYCDGMAVAGRAYCGEHAAIAYTTRVAQAPRDTSEFKFAQWNT